MYVRFNDMLAIKIHMHNIKKFFVFHETSGYFIEVEKETYDGLKKLSLGEKNQLTKEEKAKLSELFYHTRQLPPIQLPDNIEEPPHLLGGSLNVSQACNFSCVYCYANKGLYGNEKPKLMDPKTAKKSVDLLLQKSDKVAIITFFGGEPLLNFRVVKEVVEYAKTKGKQLNKEVYFTITTNGYLLTPEIADFLLENDFDINISLDGYAELHNKNRPLADGSPTYDVVVNNIKYALKRAKALGRFRGIGLKATLMPDQVQEAYKVYTHLKENFTPPVIAIGFATLSDHTISKEHVDAYLKELQKIAIHELETFGEFNRVFFGDFILQFRDIYSGRVKPHHCGAGFGSISIDVDGNIYPCQRFVTFSNFKLGDIHAFSLIDLSKFAGQKYTPFNHEPCKSCWLKFYCRNFCYYDNMVYTGRIILPSKISCYYAKEKFKIGLWLYSRLYDEYESRFEEYLKRSAAVPKTAGDQGAYLSSSPH